MTNDSHSEMQKEGQITISITLLLIIHEVHTTKRQKESAHTLDEGIGLIDIPIIVVRSALSIIIITMICDTVVVVIVTGRVTAFSADGLLGSTISVIAESLAFGKIICDSIGHVAIVIAIVIEVAIIIKCALVTHVACTLNSDLMVFRSMS